MTEEVNRGGRPPFEPTDRQREQVKNMAAIGMPHKHIAAMLGIAEKTLRKHFEADLASGAANADGKVRNVLFKMATETDFRFTHKQQRAAEFWAKHGLGMKETTKLEHTGEDGGPIKQQVIYTTGPEDGF